MNITATDFAAIMSATPLRLFAVEAKDVHDSSTENRCDVALQIEGVLTGSVRILSLGSQPAFDRLLELSDDDFAKEAFRFAQEGTLIIDISRGCVTRTSRVFQQLLQQPLTSGRVVFVYSYGESPIPPALHSRMVNLSMVPMS